jgi:hypothetical protein
MDAEETAMPRRPTARRPAESRWIEVFPLLPAQLLRPSPAAEVTRPERRLMLALLSDAVVVLQRRAPGHPGDAARDVKEAERWVLSDDRRWPYSFVNVCDALGLAHQPLRRALLGCSALAGAARRTSRRRLLAGKHGAGAAPGAS